MASSPGRSLQNELRRELQGARQTTEDMQRGAAEYRQRATSISPTDGVNQTVLSRLSEELSYG
jgi:hypothetical protein